MPDDDDPDPLDAPLLTATEAGAALGVSTSTVLRLIRDGRLPALRVGHVLRLHPADVRRFAACDAS